MKKTLLFTAVLFIIIVVGYRIASVNRRAVVEQVEKEEVVTLDPQKVYLFTKNGCPYCEAAEAYIAEHHSDFNIEIRDIHEGNNFALFLACAQRFGVQKRMLGTPLICMPDDFILGWGEASPKKLDAYIEAHK